MASQLTRSKSRNLSCGLKILHKLVPVTFLTSFLTTALYHSGLGTLAILFSLEYTKYATTLEPLF